MAYLFLLAAIAAEVLGTSLLKASDGFTRLWPTATLVAAYVTAFLLLSQAVKGMSVGVAYAMWSGLGTAAIVAIGAAFLGEPADDQQGPGRRPRDRRRRDPQPGWRPLTTGHRADPHAVATLSCGYTVCHRTNLSGLTASRNRSRRPWGTITPRPRFRRFSVARKGTCPPGTMDG